MLLVPLRHGVARRRRAVVGLCKLSSVETHSLKAPGFNPSAYEVKIQKLLLSNATCTATPRRALAAAPRRAGWRALEIECDGVSTTLKVDGEVVSSGLPPAKLSAVALHAGHHADAAAAEPAPAYWSTVFAARRAPASAPVVITLGTETLEAWAGAGAAWVSVSTSGAAPVPSRGAASAELAGALYVWGGLPAKAGSPSSAAPGGAVHTLDLASSPPAWSRVDPVGASYPGRRANHVLAAHEADGGGKGGGFGANGVVLVHGGRSSGGELLGDVWSFTPADAAWEQLYSSGGSSGGVEVPPALHLHAGAARGGALYVFGGAGADGAASAATWRFTLNTRVWTELTQVQAVKMRPPARVGAAAAAAPGGGGFYVVGGADGAGARMADAWRFDAGTERWAPVFGAAGVAGGVDAAGVATAGPPVHSRAAAAVAPGTLFLFGGEGENANHDVLWRLPTF
jgi:hypothetical protein